MALKDVPPEVRALYDNIAAALEVVDSTDLKRRKYGDAQYGVYCFYDFDGEPIYVGQTTEQLRSRIRRHLTNQRTDAVAMFVLDPYEVHTIGMWPLWKIEDDDDLQGKPKKTKEQTKQTKALMDRAEWTVYDGAINNSRFKGVLNEGFIARKSPIALPDPYMAQIAPKGWQRRNEHPDVRIARRAQTFSALAKVASERNVSMGLRRTLVVQAKRMLHLAESRYKLLGGASVTAFPEPGESGEVEGIDE